MAASQGKRVMVAVDDSVASAEAFEWTLANLISEGDHLIILSAAPYATMNYPNADMIAEYGMPILMSEPTLEKAEKKATSRTKLFVQKYIDTAKEKNITCEGEVVKGDAGSWIVDEGERVNADVIVVGSHAKGLLERTFVGSVSDYVLHNAPCTVAIVRHLDDAEKQTDQEPVQAERMRKIVIAVDDSKEAIFAFAWALKFLCKPSDRVILYHVHHPSFSPFTGVGAEVYIPVDMSIKDEVESLKESQKIVEKFMKYADHETQIHCEGIVVSGQTEEKVIQGLLAMKADAVVVGTHDRGAVARTFLGSVCDHLSHNSPCPLIVAKPRKDSKTSSETQPESEISKQHST